MRRFRFVFIVPFLDFFPVDFVDFELKSSFIVGHCPIILTKQFFLFLFNIFKICGSEIVLKR
jgi:hypothetical protein